MPPSHFFLASLQAAQDVLCLPGRLPGLLPGLGGIGIVIMTPLLPEILIHIKNPLDGKRWQNVIKRRA